MIDVSLLALTRAWVTTVVAAAALLAAMATEQNWNSAVYWRGLPQAFALISEEGPPPIIESVELNGFRPRLAGLHPVARGRPLLS